MNDLPIVIKKVKEGDQVAIQKLYKHFESYWFMLCLRYGHNHLEAEDIFQEGLMNIFQHIGSFKPERASFKTWSSRVFVHAAIKYLKQHQWQRSFQALETVSEPLDETTENVESLHAKEIVQLIQQLPIGYRVVFNLYVMDGLTHLEIADLLGISVGASKSQLHKARKCLRQKIQTLLIN